MFNLTVGQLLDYIEEHKIPRDGIVCFRRIEDFYFENNRWTTVDKPGDSVQMLERYKLMAETEWNNKEDYPTMDQETIDKCKAISEEDIRKAYDQYIPASQPLKYPDDNNLYIDGHY